VYFTASFGVRQALNEGFSGSRRGFLHENRHFRV